jgi:hypothetical protein
MTDAPELPYFYTRFALSDPQKEMLKTLLDSPGHTAIFESKYFTTAQALYRKGAVNTISETVDGKFSVGMHRASSADTESGPTWPARYS